MTPEGGFRGTFVPHADGEKDGAIAEIFCHGEIFNTPEIALQLGLAAATPLPEVLQAAWQRWTVDGLHRLDGVFAWARRSGDELLLYRDSSGLRGLFYETGQDGRVAFATDLERLAGARSTAPRLSHRSLHEYLRFLDIAAPDTLFANMSAVEPGHLVRCSPAGVEIRSLAAPGHAPPPTLQFDEAVSALEGLLQHAVGARLGGATCPAAFLSGGIDSSLVCALAAGVRPDTTAVTVGFDEAACDETLVARRIASHLGLRHEVLRFGRGQVLEAFERLARQMDQPSADPALPVTVLAFEHCRGRHDAVLDGTGAEEIVGAMPPRHVRLATGPSSLLPGGLRRGLVRVMRPIPGVAGYAPIFDFEHPAETMIRWRGFTRPEIETLCGEPVSFEHTQFYRTYARFPRHAHFERYSALVEAMPGERLTQAMRIADLDVRFPFRDRATESFVRQLRTDFRDLPGQPKRILRALLARYVPREIWDLPKQGFNFPLLEFLVADDHRLVRRHLDRDRWRRAALLSPDAVQGYAQRFIAGDRSLLFRVWALVVLSAWLEHHDGLQ